MNPPKVYPSPKREKHFSIDVFMNSGNIVVFNEKGKIILLKQPNHEQQAFIVQ